jgi:hypothetical protein
MKEKYKDYLLESSIYKVYNGKTLDYYDYYDKISKYYYSIDVAEDPEKVKAEKIAKERERKINSILS